MDKVIINIGGVDIEMDKEEVSKAIETGKIEVKSDELVTYKKDEFETFKTNLSNEEYKKGKVAGSEMTIKEAREKFELEFEGKSLDNFAEAFKNKIITEAKAEPSKKIQELEIDKKKLQENYSTLQTQFETYKNQITEKEVRNQKDSILLKNMPDNLLVDKDIALLALKNKTGIDVSFDEANKALIAINGQVKKDDKSLEPIEINKDYITEALTSLNLIAKKEGGKGGDDEPGGGSSSNYDKFVKEMEDNNISEGSHEFNLEMQKRIGNKTLTF